MTCVATPHPSPLSSCVEVLLSAGAAVDCAAAGGQTSLSLACEAGGLDCVRILLSAGADRSLATTVGLLCFWLGWGAVSQMKLPFIPQDEKFASAHETKRPLLISTHYSGRRFRRSRAASPPPGGAAAHALYRQCSGVDICAI